MNLGDLIGTYVWIRYPGPNDTRYQVTGLDAFALMLDLGRYDGAFSYRDCFITREELRLNTALVTAVAICTWEY